MLSTEERTISQTIKALESRGFHGLFVPNKEKAKDKILELVPRGSTISVGDSTTLFQIGAISEL